MSLRFILSYHGSSHLQFGLAVDDSDRLATWRTGGAQIGRFGRELTAAESSALATAIARAKTAVPQFGSDRLGRGLGDARQPSGASEQLLVDGLPDVTIAANSSGPLPYQELIAILRQLGQSPAKPVSSVELAVTWPPSGPEHRVSAQLVYAGTEPMRVQIDQLVCSKKVYDADYSVVDEASVHVQADIDTPVSSGWRLPVLAGEPVSLPADGFVQIAAGPVRLDALGDGVLRTVELSWESQ